MRLVVLGWGNESRGDDGLGPQLLRRIEQQGRLGIATIEDYQLQIEHALDLEGAELALFVDAGRDTPAPFRFAELAPSADATHTTHALSPEAVLDVYRKLKGGAPPPSFALCVRGESFGLGEDLSALGAARLEAAAAFCEELMARPSPEAWRKLAAQGMMAATSKETPT